MAQHSTQPSHQRNPGFLIRHKTSGFTLTEVLIAVTVLALLSAIALPNYNNYIRTTRRSEAIQSLTESQQILENCRINSATRTYTGCNTQVTSAIKPDYYDIVVSLSSVNGASGDMGYTVTATPKAGTTQVKDTKCSSYSIDQVGNRSATDPTCWK